MYLFSVLCHAWYLVDYIVKGSWKGRGKQVTYLVKVLYCKLLINSKLLPALPHEARLGFKHLLQLVRNPIWVGRDCHNKNGNFNTYQIF